MLALDVFSEAIGYLRRHVMQACDKQGFKLSPTEIKWVLTVPAIWGDAAKQFMRRAAEQVSSSIFRGIIPKSSFVNYDNGSEMNTRILLKDSVKCCYKIAQLDESGK